MVSPEGPPQRTRTGASAAPAAAITFSAAGPPAASRSRMAAHRCQRAARGARREPPHYSPHNAPRGRQPPPQLSRELRVAMATRGLPRRGCHGHWARPPPPAASSAPRPGPRTPSSFPSHPHPPPAGPRRPRARSRCPPGHYPVPPGGPPPAPVPPLPVLPRSGGAPGRPVASRPVPSCHMARWGVPAAAATGGPDPPPQQDQVGEEPRGGSPGRTGGRCRHSPPLRPGPQAVPRPQLPGHPQEPVGQKGKRGRVSGHNRAAVFPRGKADLPPPQGSAITQIALLPPPIPPEPSWQHSVGRAERRLGPSRVERGRRL